MSDLGRLRWHVLALVVGLVAVWPLLDLDGAFISDEGSYVTQARAVAAGDWDVGYAFEAVDPAGTNLPYHGTIRGTEGTFTFAKHPSWPWVLGTSSDLVGEPTGMRVPGAASLVLLAVVAWCLAGRLGGPSVQPWAFWVAAVSPALGSAWITWAHVPAAAAGGLLVLAMIAAREDARWLIVVGFASAAGVLLRTEAILWSAAIATAVILSEPGRRAVRDAAVVVGSAGLAVLLDREWSRVVVGDSISGTGGTGEVGGTLTVREEGATALDRLRGFRLAVIDGSFSADDARALAVASAVLVLLALWLHWRGRKPTVVASVLGLAAVLFVGRVLLEPSDPIPGLLVAAPILLLAIWWRGAGWERALPIAVALFAMAIAVTIYPDGGSIQWGGRFLSPALAPLAVMAAAGITRLIGADGPRHPVAWAVVAVLVAQAIGAVVVPDRIRREASEAVDTVVATGEPVLVANGKQIARLDLGGWPERCWMGVPEGAGARGLASALDQLGASGIERATVVGFDPATVQEAGAEVDRWVPDVAVAVVSVPSTTSAVEIAGPYRCEEDR